MRAILRFLGFLAAVAGFVALVIDVTRYFANDSWRAATLLEALNSAAPGAGETTASVAESLAGPFAGQAAAWCLSAPVWASGLIAGFAMMYLFRRRIKDDRQGF